MISQMKIERFEMKSYCLIKENYIKKIIFLYLSTNFSFNGKIWIYLQ